WEQIENWFLGTSEGNDGGNTFDINDYDGIIVEKQILPRRNDFYDAFPKIGTAGMPSKQVYELVGGHMWDAHKSGNTNYQNACAIRISRALNYSRKPIPIFKNKLGEQKSEKGKDNLNYILDASSLLAYMLKSYSDNPPLHLEGKTPGEYLKALKGKWGIYIMIPKNSKSFGASGHADFFSQTGCLSGCYFSDADEIYFWELKQ
ncbi:T6SS effector amidase Tae4 family protein, partial [Flavobacterium sp. XS1P32]